MSYRYESLRSVPRGTNALPSVRDTEYEGDVTYNPHIAVDSLSRALTEAGNAFASMLRRVKDPDRHAIGSWTVGDTAAHAAHSPKYFLEAAQGTTALAALDDVADHNAEFLSDDPEHDPRVLADRFENNELALTTYAGTLDGDPAVEVFDGVVVPVSTLLAVELGEVLVHGYDIAGASGLDWPIAADHAALTVGGLLPILPHVIDPVKAAGFDARFRSASAAASKPRSSSTTVSSRSRRLALSRSTVASPSTPPPTSSSASTASTPQSPPSKARSSHGAEDPGSRSR